jgi:N-acetylmuramoyl-L-alanine amidase
MRSTKGVVRKIIVHASGKAGDNYERIDARHRRRGLMMIGFHYVIGEDGFLTRGRQLSAAGAHCLGYNADSVGICLCGNGLPTVAQMKKLHGLARRLRRRFPNADMFRVGELDVWMNDPLKLDINSIGKERSQ